MKKKSSKKFSFKGQVANDAQRQQKAASSYGYLSLPKGLTVFSPEPGSRVMFDIIPYVVTDPKHPDRNVDGNTAVEGNPWYKRPFKLHRNVGSTNDIAICPTSIGKKCPICEFRVKRIKAGAEKDETDALKASLRNLYLVIPKGHKKFEEEVHLFDISQYNFQNLLNEELQEDNSNEDFPSLEDGKSLKVRFDSKTIGGSQPFAVASRIDFEERDEQYSWDILEESPNLDEILNIPSYEELRAKFTEEDDEETGGKLRKVKDDDDDEEEEEEEEETPKARTRKIVKRSTPTKRKPVEDDEDEEEEEDVDEEEEEVKPTKKTSSKKVVKKKPVDEDEDEDEEDEDDDEEEEEVKPKKVVKGKCPSGYRFGIDTEKYDECEDCEVWDECMEAKRKRKAK